MSAIPEIDAVLSEFNHKKMIMHRALNDLHSEKKNIEGMRRMLDNAMAHTEEKISEKTIYYTSRLKKNIMDSQRRIEKTSRESASLIEEKIKDLETFTRKSKTELQRLMQDLVSFRKGVDDNFNRIVDSLFSQQKTFEKSVSRKVDVSISAETKRVKNALDIDLTAKMDQLLLRQNKLVENMKQQIGTFEEMVGLIQSEQNARQKAQKEKESRWSKIVGALRRKQDEHQKRLSPLDDRLGALDHKLTRLTADASLLRKVQDGHQARLPDLEERLRTVERRLEEMNQKSGFFSFFRRRKPRPERVYH